MIAMLIILLTGWFVARQTYGGSHGLFPVGYFIHDQANTVAATAGSSQGSLQVAGLMRFLPFGFHPRTLWSNVHAYLISAFGFWLGLSLVGIAIDLKRHSGRDRRRLFFYGTVVWTLIVLFVLYGQSVFTDNITGEVTIGNSFLRYLLPLVPLIAIGCAVTIDALFRRPRGIAFGSIAIVLFVLLNIVTAFARDDEGILRTRYELQRYREIRYATERQVPRGSMILSERSDKIFETGPFIVVSPIPDQVTLDRIQHGTTPVFYFTRTFLDETSQHSDPVVKVFGGATPIFSLQNETMYALPSVGQF
jgi:uncharacterized membrane protein YhaH (DUF805 family)